MKPRCAFLLAAFALAGCDIPGRLVFKNRTGAPAHVRLLIQASERTNEIVLVLGPEGEQRTRYVSFGFGEWFKDSGLDRHVERLERIDLVTERDSVSISDKAEIRAHLIAGRRGLAKAVCVWKVE